MGKWGRCMIFGVEVGCTESDRATSDIFIPFLIESVTNVIQIKK
jgi:hypothetical protein